MSLDITDALSDGLGRTFERNGLLLMAVFVVLGAINVVVSQTNAAAGSRFLRRQFAEMPAEQMPGPGGAFPGPGGAFPGPEATPFALPVPVPLPVALVLVLLVALLAEAVRIVAVRTLVSDETEGLPADATRRLPVATLNGFVGGVIVLVLVGVGLLLLVVPGVFLALSFFFVRQEVAVEDKNALDALAGSWELTSGHRLELFALALVIVVVGLAVSAVGGIVGFLGITALTTVVTTLLGAVTTVFGVAVAARAYVQLRGGDAAAVDDTESEWDVQV
jgi:hypothetical protein